MTTLPQPQLSHRWRIRILNNSLERDIRNSVTCQAASVKIDYLKQLLTLKIRQDAVTSNIHEAVMNMTRERNRVLVETFVTNEEGAGFAWALLFHAIVTEHDFILDYTAKDPLVNHTLVLKFDPMPKILTNSSAREEYLLPC